MSKEGPFRVGPDSLELSATKQSLRRRAAKMGAAALATLSVVVPVTANAFGIEAREAMGYMGSLKKGGCGPVNEQERLTVLNSIRTSSESSSPEDFEDIVELATEHGFELVDSRPYTQMLNDSPTVGSTVSIFNEYTSKLGFSTAVEDQATKYIDSRPLAHFNEGVARMMYGMSTLPTRFYDIANLEHLQIGRIMTSPDGMANLQRREISLSTLSIYEDPRPGQIFSHELGHLIDWQLCGSWSVENNDPEFTSLNPPGFQYARDKASKFKNTLSDYAATEPDEDKAVTLEAVLTFGLERVWLKKHTPAVNDKVRLLVARLEQQAPGASAYLAGLR